jgi:hypothetical protein
MVLMRLASGAQLPPSLAKKSQHIEIEIERFGAKVTGNCRGEPGCSYHLEYWGVVAR